MYSADKINDVLRTYHDRETLGLTVDQIADLFKISKSTLYKWVNDPPNIINGERIFNRNAIVNEYDKVVVNHVVKNGSINHSSINDALSNKYGKMISRSTIYKILKRNNITRKRIQTKKHNYKLRAKHDKQLVILRKSVKNRKKRIISIDETSMDFLVRNMVGQKRTLNVQNQNNIHIIFFHPSYS